MDVLNQLTDFSLRHCRKSNPDQVPEYNYAGAVFLEKNLPNLLCFQPVSQFDAHEIA